MVVAEEGSRSGGEANKVDSPANQKALVLRTVRDKDRQRDFFIELRG
jgi:hypothetical protein